jgi:hypothetical protein
LIFILSSKALRASLVGTSIIHEKASFVKRVISPAPIFLLRRGGERKEGQTRKSAPQEMPAFAAVYFFRGSTSMHLTLNRADLFVSNPQKCFVMNLISNFPALCEPLQSCIPFPLS